MAVNKNFVVKNGLEVSTDLIFADASTDKVGIGSTIPASMLDVKGGIAVTDINATGVGTIVTIRSTTGIVSTVDAISLQATNLTISGVATGISIETADQLLVAGVTSTGSLQVVGTGNMPLGIITNAQGSNLNYNGIGTITSGIVTHLVANNLNVGGISSVRSGITSHLVVNNLNVGGISSVRSGIASHLVVNNLNVGGISTIGNFIVTKSSGGIGATVGAAVGVITYYGDGVNLLNTGGGIGIRTTGAVVGYGFTILNFVGAGNTFATDGTTVDISIAGGGGGASVSIGSESPSDPESGNLWYHTEYGRTFVYFDEVTLGIGNTAVWVDAAPFNQGGQFLGKYGDNAYGAIGYTGGTTSQASIYYTGDANTGIYFPAADHVGVVAGGTKSLEVNPNGATVTGILTASDAYISGILTAQTLNYNNVTDIYSTGIITATRGIQQTGNEGLNVTSGITTVGILTATIARVGLGVTINNTGIDAGIAAGIVTAYQFWGDGSNITGIAAGGSGEFNTSISGATQYDVTTSMATAYTANASSDHRTIVHSIHICNISAAEASISGEIQASFSFAHTIPVPAGSAVELLHQPKVLGPSETIELQSDTASALEATIIVEYKEDTDFWDAQLDLTSASTMTDIYTSTTNPSVVQSILLANDDGSNDVKARVVWTDGSNNIQSYLCYDMVIPADSTVELCEKPKYLAAGYKLRGYANQADRLEITASGKQITS